jgi:regulator of RNase E activity RraA
MNRKLQWIVAAAAALCASMPAHAQLWTWTKDQLIEYTKDWKGERFADGRPKVPESFLERAKEMSQEEVLINWGNAGGPAGGRGMAGGPSNYSQFAGDFQVLHPGKKMVGRALTVQFMPRRPDLDNIVLGKAKEKGVQQLNNQYAIDMVQPGDILVVDLFGKKEGGTIVGDNLFYYIMKASHGAGLVLEGSFRDLEGISEFDMPCYYRAVHPTAISYALGGVQLSGINIPIRVGGVTVMPGDLVMGDREGVSFIPPQLAQDILDNADTIHVHDEWTKKKFDEGKYKSSEIYSTPKDPALKKEYDEYLKKRLEEIRKSRQN